MAGLYFLLVTILPVVLTLPATNTRNLLSDTISTLDKALTFFSSDYSSINVDGLFGLRLGQGQLIEAANLCSKKESCGSYLQQIKSMNERLGDTCEKALPYVDQSDPDYYKRFEKTISKPYILPYTRTKFDQRLLSTIRLGTKSSYTEEKGDVCYSRIMGTYSEKNTGLQVPQCNITNDCLKMMTSTGTSRYALTHQLLFFMVVEHVGCTEQVQNFIKGRNLFDIEKQFCQKIYKEADSLVLNGKVKSSQQDLFLEQSVLCGALGFEDFFRPDWIAMTLTWPDKKEGCMKMNMHDMLGIATGDIINSVEKHPDQVKDFLGKVGSKLEEKFEDELKKLSGESKTMRKLLREKAMKDGCMAHASGLAFGTFGSYVHYLIQQL